MKLTLLGAVLLAPFLLFSQQHQHRCGSFDVIANWEQQYPGTQATLNQILVNAQNAELKQAQNKGFRSGNDVIYRIPVVVHIVYTTPAENLDDSLVYSQLEVLNNAFRRTSADTINTRPEFLPYAGDAGIEFFLADTDPNGQPTTGITRTSTTQPAGFGFSPFNDAMKKSADGGIDAWPTDRYLNIWVCDINSVPFFGSVLGYAYPPVGNLSNWPAGAAPADTTVQGVVIYHKIFGRNNPLAIADPALRTVALGKSCVHEVGHYLGLRHIWGEDATNPLGGGSCTLDDFIGDTPETINRSEQACDLTKNECGPSCPNLPDVPDMIENYMDYSVDSCNNMFTYGQIALMRGILANYRPNLGQTTLGTIKTPSVGASTGTLTVSGSDSLVITIDFTRWNDGSGYPYRFNIGDTIVTPDSTYIVEPCQTIVLYPGDYLVDPTGDTLAINIGDTINSFDDGTVNVRPFVETTGIGSVSKPQFSLFPNPTTGLVSIRMNAGINAQSISLVNLLGQTVYAQPITQLSNIILDLNHLAPGVYLVQVQASEGVTTQRLVIE